MGRATGRHFRATLMYEGSELDSLADFLLQEGYEVRRLTYADEIAADSDFYVLGDVLRVSESHLRSMRRGAVLFCQRLSRTLRELATDLYGLIIEEPSGSRNWAVIARISGTHGLCAYSRFIALRMARWTGFWTT